MRGAGSFGLQTLLFNMSLCWLCRAATCNPGAQIGISANARSSSAPCRSLCLAYGVPGALQSRRKCIVSPDT